MSSNLADLPLDTIEWGDSLQKAGLILTEKLRDYWEDRARRCRDRIFPNLNQPQISYKPRPMEYNRRYLRTNSWGNPTQTEEE